MDIKTPKKIGIWGFGIVGKATLEYLRSLNHELSVMDKRTLTHNEQAYLDLLNIPYYPETESDHFFSVNDSIIKSPGISLDKAQDYAHKCIEELDLFAAAWQKPLIAVTGSLGKTSVVHMLSQFLEHQGLNVVTGGNIGIGMLSLVHQQTDADYGLLELSSFQLERCKQFAPDIALWTNLFPNHIDRHGSLENYFKAKYALLAQQKEHQQALVPMELVPQIRAYTQRPLHIFLSKETGVKDHLLHTNDIIYRLDTNCIIKETARTSSKIEILNSSNNTYQENILMIVALADMLSLTVDNVVLPELTTPTHRLEKLGIIHNRTFYNDSKSSIFEATLAAVERLSSDNVHLFLGGIGKGIDRSSLIEQLKGKVASITCFGSEAQELYQACKRIDIKGSSHSSLEEAFIHCVNNTKAGDTILFSPSGASFDLFKNFEERGNRFKELVEEFKQKEAL